MKRKKDLVILEAFFSLWFFSFFLRCNPRFPFAYKRESRAPLPWGSGQEIKNTRA